METTECEIHSVNKICFDYKLSKTFDSYALQQCNTDVGP